MFEELRQDWLNGNLPNKFPELDVVDGPDCYDEHSDSLQFADWLEKKFSEASFKYQIVEKGD